MLVGFISSLQKARIAIAGFEWQNSNGISLNGGTLMIIMQNQSELVLGLQSFRFNFFKRLAPGFVNLSATEQKRFAKQVPVGPKWVDYVL